MFETTKQKESRTSPLPNWLRIWWILAAPLGIAFSLRILWEKTILTAEKGEQMIGFTLAHIFPLFLVGGLLSSFALFCWLIVALVFVFRVRFKISIYDLLMFGGVLIVIMAMFLPDDFGLHFR